MPPTDELAKGSCCARSSVGGAEGVTVKVEADEEAEDEVAENERDVDGTEDDDRLSALMGGPPKNDMSRRMKIMFRMSENGWFLNVKTRMSTRFRAFICTGSRKARYCTVSIFSYPSVSQMRENKCHRPRIQTGARRQVASLLQAKCDTLRLTGHERP